MLFLHPYRSMGKEETSSPSYSFHAFTCDSSVLLFKKFSNVKDNSETWDVASAPHREKDFPASSSGDSWAHSFHVPVRMLK